MISEDHVTLKAVVMDAENSAFIEINYILKYIQIEYSCLKC